MGQCIAYIPFEIFFYVGIVGVGAFASTFFYTLFEKHLTNINEKIRKIENSPKIDKKTGLTVIRTRLEKFLLRFKLRFFLVFLLICLAVQIIFTIIYWLGLKFSLLTTAFWYSCTIDSFSYLGLVPAIIGGIILFTIILFIILVLTYSISEDK